MTTQATPQQAAEQTHRATAPAVPVAAGGLLVTTASGAGRAARTGLWALPAYGLLLGLSTLTHQPSVDDFDAYARYVTTDLFVVSHLTASIGGAAAAILGAVAVTAFLVHGRAARTAVAGLVLTTVTNVFMAAAFGSATFVQPGIGRAHLAGVPGMPAINADTAYGPTFFATALTSTFFLAVAAAVLGTAIARTSTRLRWHGSAYAVLIPAFALSGFVLQPVQPFTGFALAAATAALAVRLPHAMLPAPAPDADDGASNRTVKLNQFDVLCGACPRPPHRMRPLHHRTS